MEPENHFDYTGRDGRKAKEKRFRKGETFIRSEEKPEYKRVRKEMRKIISAQEN